MGGINIKPIPAETNLPLMELLNLGEPKAGKNHPETSKDALKKLKYDSFRAQILYILSLYEKGLTTVELGDIMGFPRDYISPHPKVLVGLGLMRKDGKRENPKTISNAECEVYFVTQKYLDSQLKIKTQQNWNKIQEIELRKRLIRVANQINYLRLDYRSALEKMMALNQVELDKIFPAKLCNKSSVYNSIYCFSVKVLDLEFRCFQCGGDV